MQKGISIRRIWSDDDVAELRIVVADLSSSFCTTAYAGHGHIRGLSDQLRTFRGHVHGGIKDIRLGKFGPEFANGAFHARLHFLSPGRLYISTHQQSDFVRFSVGQVASEAKMHLVSEPILLDGFIAELAALASGMREDAALECV